MLPVILLAAGALVLVSSSGKKESEEPSLEGIQMTLAGVDIAIQSQPRGSTSTTSGKKRDKAQKLLPKIKKVNFGAKVKHMSGASGNWRPNPGECKNPPIVGQLQVNQLKVVASQVPMPRQTTTTRGLEREAAKVIQAKLVQLSRT